jgi:hypothetical protein
VRRNNAAPDPVATSISVRVQEMSFTDQVTILARIAQLHSEDRTFSIPDLEAVFYANNLPQPKNLHDVSAKLRKAGYLTPAKNGKLTITPRGRQRSLELLSEMDLAAFFAESASPTTVFGSLLHTVVPPELAPPKLIPALRRFLELHPFETNVFGMTRFPDASCDPKDIDPVKPTLQIARDVCKKHGLTFHLASDRAIDDDLWTNVAAQMWASQYGIAFFEDRRRKGMNYNLNIEVGGMLITGRRCALLKDSSITKLPTDLVGHIYRGVDFDEPRTVENSLHNWIRNDLGLGSCPDCPDEFDI